MFLAEPATQVAIKNISQDLLDQFLKSQRVAFLLLTQNTGSKWALKLLLISTA